MVIMVIYRPGWIMFYCSAHLDKNFSNICVLNDIIRSDHRPLSVTLDCSFISDAPAVNDTPTSIIKTAD